MSSEQNYGGGANVLDRLKAVGVPLQPQKSKEAKKPTGGNPKATSPASAVVSASAFAIKPLPSFKVLKPEDRAAMLEGLTEFKKKIPSVMSDLVTFRREVERLTPEEKLGYKAQLDEANGLIADYLNRPGVAGVTAKVALADALVRTCPEIRGVVVATADELIRIRFAREVSFSRRGAVQVYDRAILPDEELAKIPGVAEVMKAFAGLVDRTRAAGKKYFQEAQQGLKIQEGDNPLSVDELLSGKDGRRILPIPDQMEVVRGREFSHKGGNLLVEVSDGAVSVIGGIGGVARLLDRFAGLSLSVDLLGNEEFKPKERIDDSTEFGNLRLLHKLLRLGLVEGREQEKKSAASADFKAQVEGEREALSAKATISQSEAHIGGLPGLFLQEWRPFFNQRTGRDKKGEFITRKVWFPLSLVERNDKGLIRVAEAPERLTEFFSPFRNFAEPGADYSSLGVLGILLRQDAKRAQAGSTPEEQRAAAEAKAKADAEATEAKAKADAEAATSLADELAADSGEDLTGAVIPAIPSAEESGEERKGSKRTPKPRKK